MAKRVDTERAEAPITIVPLMAFVEAVESGAFAERAEQVRRDHCLQCQGNADADPGDRDALCASSRCFLRNLDMWRFEYGWVREIGSTSLFYGTPNRDDLREFNKRLGDAACVVYGVKVDYDTGMMMGHFHAPTLRGKVHAALVEMIAWRAGDRRYNVYSTTANDLRALVGAERDEMDERDSLARSRQAATMRGQGMKDAQIAAALGRSTKAVRDWLGPAKTWPAREEEWWARHGGRNGR